MHCHRYREHPQLLKLVAMVIGFTACSASDEEGGPYLEFVGGGFIFNYRLAEADYGFVAAVKRPIPAGTVLEAEFEDPGGGAPIIIRQRTGRGRVSYLFRTPPLRGIEAHHDYQVELRLVEPTTSKVIARYHNTYRSDADQDILPRTPPVAGPGYRRSPTAGTSRLDRR